MQVNLLELKGKYYGTEIEVLSSGGIKANIKIWDCGDYTPSKRELEKQGYTEEQWANNELIDDWDEKTPIREAGIICDSHFESKQSYELALEILNKLNSK